MSQTFNPITGEFVNDAPDSNITNPADPQTGFVAPKEGIELVGPPLVGFENRYARGKDFMSAQVQLGARTKVGIDQFVCESDGSIYDAYWRKETAE